MEDTTETLIGNQDATGLNMGDRVGPSVLVKLVLGLDDGGQFGLGKEGVVYSVREGRECGGTSDGIAVKDGAFLVVILVAESVDLGLLFRLLVAAKDGRNGSREQIAHGVLLVEPLVEGAVGGAIYAIHGLVGGSGLLGLGCLVHDQAGPEGPPIAVHEVLEFAFHSGAVGIFGVEPGLGRRRGDARCSRTCVRVTSATSRHGEGCYSG
mmetsp:Transcript_26411/g.61785  ORF Transcript_26411/g.61785 Transcript_26411/m.61785 type:complete len:209 (+) Transcript_26411:788-1414(+)